MNHFLLRNDALRITCIDNNINESKIYSNLVSTIMAETKPTYSIEENDETPKFLLFGPSVSFDREIPIFVAIAIFLFFVLTCISVPSKTKKIEYHKHG